MFDLRMLVLPNLVFSRENSYFCLDYTINYAETNTDILPCGIDCTHYCNVLLRKWYLHFEIQE